MKSQQAFVTTQFIIKAKNCNKYREMDLRVLLVFVSLSVCCVMSRSHGNRNCLRPCTANYSPVCGNDGRTYSNQCELDTISSCRRRNLRKAYNGECTKETRPERDCPLVCTMQYDPVCGTDGRTYGNECGLRARSCRSKSTIEIEHRGECRD